MGAVTAIMYANRDPSIAGVVLDSPFSSLPKLMLELVAQFTKGSRVGVPKMAARMALSFVRSSVSRLDINDLDLRKVAPSTLPGARARQRRRLHTAAPQRDAARAVRRG